MPSSSGGTQATSTPVMGSPESQHSGLTQQFGSMQIVNAPNTQGMLIHFFV